MERPPKPSRKNWWLYDDQLPEEIEYSTWLFGNSVEARNELQHSGMVHPYTCGNSGCRWNTNGAPLRATEDGWVCDHCGYTQTLESNSSE